MNLFSKKFTVYLFLIFLLFVISQPVFAANITDSMITLINSAGTDLAAYNEETTAPELVAGRIINYLLGFLGILFFLLIVYAGFMWMTAAGNEEQVEKAKKIIVRSTIGLAIVITAWSITWFIYYALIDATIVAD